MELKYENMRSELQTKIEELIEQNAKLEAEKIEIDAQKQNKISELTIRITELEQSLIKCNMEIANVKSQLEIEKGLVAKLNKEREMMNLENDSFGMINGMASE